MPNGATTRYAYDALDALSAVEHDGHLLRIERDALGREVQRTSRTLREGDDDTAAIAVRSSYDAMDRLIDQRATAPAPGAPKALVTRQWLYDARGRVERIDDARWGTTAYRYDRADRLLSAQRGGDGRHVPGDGEADPRRCEPARSIMGRNASGLQRWLARVRG
ncbi:hypothetical protein [Sorangium sp. So ce381]|uniref:hypothetical protein n=1 Tax=Sorangium sp. So ce381 TaxID=3133307 RepID=UPI003F5CAB2D